MIEQVIENETKRGWEQRIKKEWIFDKYRCDVYVEFSNRYKHIKHETIIEVQKNKSEKTFVKKSKELTDRDKIVPTFHYVVIWEDDIKGMFNEDYVLIRDSILMQNGFPW